MEQIEQKFDFKKRWLALSSEEREAFAVDAGTTAGYIQTHLARRTKMPGKKLMDRIFKACKDRGWIASKEQLVMFFYSR